MSLFSIKFFGIHVVTLVAIMICFILTYVKLEIPGYNRIVISTVVTMVGVWFYDLVWLIGGNGHPINKLRLMETLILLVIMVYYNVMFSFIKVYNYFWWGMMLYAGIMLYMGHTGWFGMFHAWVADRTLPDPHNWLWAVSKIVGIVTWVFVVEEKGC